MAYIKKNLETTNLCGGAVRREPSFDTGKNDIWWKFFFIEYK